MNRLADQEVAPVNFTLDGQTVTAQPQETILQVAQKSGVDICLLYTSPSPRDS